MIACLSPIDRFLEENVSTLNYAARASLISNAPMKNVDQNVVQLQQTKNKIQDLEKELRQANEHVQFLTQMNDEKDQKIKYLESQNRKLQQKAQQTDEIVK